MITCCNVFNVWPKTTLLLPVWPRDSPDSKPCESAWHQSKAPSCDIVASPWGPQSFCETVSRKPRFCSCLFLDVPNLPAPIHAAMDLGNFLPRYYFYCEHLATSLISFYFFPRNILPGADGSEKGQINAKQGGLVCPRSLRLLSSVLAVRRKLLRSIVRVSQGSLGSGRLFVCLVTARLPDSRAGPRSTFPNVPSFLQQILIARQPRAGHFSERWDFHREQTKMWKRGRGPKGTSFQVQNTLRGHNVSTESTVSNVGITLH